MKNKIIGILGVMLMLGLTVVSAMSVDNVETSYDKKTGIVNVNFDAILNDECSGQSIFIYDKKDNLVGRSYGPGICAICIYGRCEWIRPQLTGIFQTSVDIQLTSNKNIKGLGNLRYEITRGDILANGFLK